MLDDFLIRAGLAGLAVVLATGPLGCFVVWRRMAYFGDATAHAAILGVALSLGFGAPVYLGTLGVAVAMGWLVAHLAGRGEAVDTALGVLAHGALAVGLVAASFVPGLRSNLEAWLFGDILMVQRADLIWVWGGATLVLAVLVWRWQGMVTATVNEELAMAAGINPARERLILTLAMAIIVAVAIRIVGALLVSALLVIPAASARSFARSPERMALLSTLIGAVSVACGLSASLFADTPAGPSIIAAAAAIFLFMLPFRRPMA
ncbi:iron chelate uptake ABC transporter family permease subunit [Paracoccus aurantiacus]|uniref:High-affinity zinc uptake system membrane protein ZnuB n=1 Tax=Paracoccus aurantiacus TaxID=2599412 RepID=A0A5C6S2W5_9RHOB|nr:iron chelate uptake ABC transporter family permease subunit [Paracoccus aurantiacus]TXB68795.1 iron chelate uptake ABC transporter family permease subunit [Paracoccus aurantiacus]